MKKLSFTLLAPATIAATLGHIIYVLTDNYTGSNHDVYMSNAHNSLIPVISVGCLFLVFLPLVFLMSSIMYRTKPMTAAEAQETPDFAPLNTIEVGQLIRQAGTNCTLRVKAIKNTFADLQNDQYNYILQTSLY